MKGYVIFMKFFLKGMVVLSLGVVLVGTISAAPATANRQVNSRGLTTTTPIKHLVVIFQENVSFDHYFGTYPFAQNNSGETPFKASPRTPKSINTLLTPLDTTHDFRPLAGVDLIHNNPNGNANVPTFAPNNKKTNGAGASNPFRLSPSQALTADQGHNDQPEQSAYDNGNMH